MVGERKVLPVGGIPKRVNDGIPRCHLRAARTTKGPRPHPAGTGSRCSRPFCRRFFGRALKDKQIVWAKGYSVNVVQFIPKRAEAAATTE